MLLVDAYNVLHVQGVLPAHLAGMEIDGLARLLGVSRYARGRIILVCDGAPPRTSIGGGKKVAGRAGRASHPTASGVEIVHAGGGNDADFYIEDFLERDSASRRWTVVSSDHRVQRAAISAGSRVLESALFLRQLVQDDARPAPTPHPRNIHKIPLASLDVSLWIREFGIDPRAGEADPAQIPDIVPPATAAGHIERSIEHEIDAADARSRKKAKGTSAEPAEQSTTPSAFTGYGTTAAPSSTPTNLTTNLTTKLTTNWPTNATAAATTRSSTGKPHGNLKPDARTQPANPAHAPQSAPKTSPLQLPSGLNPADLDPVLRELLAGLEGGIRLEDLDMRRWLGENGDR